MEKDKKEIRFVVSEKKHKELKNKADKLDVSLTSYIKMIINEEKNQNG